MIEPINMENGQDAKNINNTLHFRRLGSNHDINSRGVLWYKQNLNEGADYKLLFSYLGRHLEERVAGLRPHLVDILRSQVAFQELYMRLKEEGTHSDGSLIITDDALLELTNASKKLEIYKRKFGASSQLGKTAAGKVLLDLSRTAKKAAEDAV